LLARQANTDGSVTANFGESTTWGNDDPSVFAVTIVKGLQGEYQICNGYGKEKATQVMNVRKLKGHLYFCQCIWFMVDWQKV
jgi:hypothetical protein